MKLRLGRIAVAAVIADVVGLFTLISLVAIFRPSDPALGPTSAAHLGSWLGPLCGSVVCLAGGYWVARHAAPHGTGNGAAMGLAAALLNLAGAAALGVLIQPAMLLAAAARIAGGALGGRLASVRARVVRRKAFR
jgi:hypothetical protein